MKVVLFCGGFGMRMRDGVSSGPKPMAMVGQRPLLWHVMRYYAHFGHTDFVLCLGYGASYVKDFFLSYDETGSNDFVLENGARDITLFSTDISDWRITFVDTGLASPIGERLRRVRRFVESEPMFMANYADVLTDAPLPDMISRFEASNAVASLLAVPLQSSHHVVDIGEDSLITRVTPMRNLLQWENGGYFVLRPEIFDYLNEGEDLVDDALIRLVSQGRVLAYSYKGYWTPADTVKERVQLEEMYERGYCPWMIWDKERSGADQPLSSTIGGVRGGSVDSPVPTSTLGEVRHAALGANYFPWPGAVRACAGRAP
jgi:glucose-1-phosphate cytidylyltransferase